MTLVVLVVSRYLVGVVSGQFRDSARALAACLTVPLESLPVRPYTQAVLCYCRKL